MKPKDVRVNNFGRWINLIIEFEISFYYKRFIRANTISQVTKMKKRAAARRNTMLDPHLDKKISLPDEASSFIVIIVHSISIVSVFYIIRMKYHVLSQSLFIVFRLLGSFSYIKNLTQFS